MCHFSSVTVRLFLLNWLIFALSPWTFLHPLISCPATPLSCPVPWQLTFGDHHVNTVPSHPGFCVKSLPFSPVVRVVKQDAVSRWSTVCVLFLIPCFPSGAATFHETVSRVLLCFSLNNRKNGFCMCITWAYLEWTEGSVKVVQKGEGRMLGQEAEQKECSSRWWVTAGLCCLGQLFSYACLGTELVFLQGL